jgi:hypothetical protein
MEAARPRGVVDAGVRRHGSQAVTPDFTRKTECFSRVRQDQLTHT